MGRFRKGFFLQLSNYLLYLYKIDWHLGLEPHNTEVILEKTKVRNLLLMPGFLIKVSRRLSYPWDYVCGLWSWRQGGES